MTEPLTPAEQDHDGYESYFAAIAEIRRRRVAEGLEEPLPEERETRPTNLG